MTKRFWNQPELEEGQLGAERSEQGSAVPLGAVRWPVGDGYLINVGSVHAHYGFGCSAPSDILVIVIVVVVVVVVAAAFSVVAGIPRSWQQRPYQSGIHRGRREEAGLEHPKCLNLAKLHSTAVDLSTAVGQPSLGWEWDLLLGVLR
ncbi:hypothetical protein QBC37DRAFT_488357 [Rhypophila decipiens]|uniref:Uncharacterized protein n=1 Tax=Rhypophila decipiens TaxID=261697 RepID=A0AAN7AYE2_9PEZI|nr:hypothetical protein QBC37DRAFT_488357 [Rhypophila decipiens]